MKANDVERVLGFWFGALDEQGRAAPEVTSRWWKQDATFDSQVRACFEADYQAILAGERESWLSTPRGRLAYVVVLDQFGRNMYRGSPQMFAADPRALRVALAGIADGEDRQLALDERAFLYLPLMHSEDLAIQERCVELFQTFHDELEGARRERVANNLDFAIRHRDIVAQWGRFPHRNAVLGRASTPEEVAFLRQPGSSF